MDNPIIFPSASNDERDIIHVDTVGVTCDSAAADQVCEGGVEDGGAPEVRVQQDLHSLSQLVKQPGVCLVHQIILSQLGC